MSLFLLSELIARGQEKTRADFLIRGIMARDQEKTRAEVLLGRGGIMLVMVTNNDGNKITYGYAPEHYAGVNLFYAELLEHGDISAYTIEL